MRYIELTPSIARQLLTDPIRRSILVYLYERDRPVMVSELAVHLAAQMEQKKTPNFQLGWLTIDNLRQVYLPDLQQAGLVQIKEKGKTVVEPTWRLSEFDQELEPHMNSRSHYIQ